MTKIEELKKELLVCIEEFKVAQKEYREYLFNEREKYSKKMNEARDKIVSIKQQISDLHREKLRKKTKGAKDVKDVSD